MGTFKNKIAIVTGGASGIGAKINATGGKAAAHYLDVSDSEAVERLVARVAAENA